MNLPIVDVSAGIAALSRASVEGGIGVVLGLLLNRRARRAPAQVRCWVWRLLLLKFILALVLPATILVPLLPPEVVTTTTIPANDPSFHQPAFRPSHSQTAMHTPSLGTIDRPSAGAPTAARLIPEPARVPWDTILATLWALGLGAAAVRLIVRGALASRWRRNFCRPMRDPVIGSACHEIGRSMGLRRMPQLSESDTVTLPLVIGFVHPTIVLPSEPHRDVYDAASMRQMLAHELAHIRRNDLRWTWLNLMVQALFFFHPLAWIACREEEIAREEACDAMAITYSGATPAMYGGLLYAMTTQSCRVPRFAAIGMAASLTQIKRRLASLQTGRMISRRHLLVARIVVVVGAAIGLTPWRLGARAAQTPEPLSGRATSSAATRFGNTETGVIYGRVTDTSGKPLPGRLYVYTEDARVPRKVEGMLASPVEADGTYRIVLPAGAYTILVSPPNTASTHAIDMRLYGEPSMSIETRGGVYVRSGHQQVCNFLLPRLKFAMPVTGFVDGPDGRPVGGARVQFADPSYDDGPMSVVTDTGGQFRLDYLPSTLIGHTYDFRASLGVWVSHPQRYVVETARSVVGNSHDANRMLRLRLVRDLGASVSGRITAATTGQALQGIAVRIVAFSGGAGLRTETMLTGTDGRYQFLDLWPDMEYAVEAQQKGYVGAAIPTLGNFELRPGEVRSNPDLALVRATSTFAGVIVDQHGQPVPSAIISVSAGSGDFHGMATDAHGCFRFDGLGDGALDVRGRGPGGTETYFHVQARAPSMNERIVLR